MSRATKSEKLVRKAEQALITAIEAYNRPDSKYREETFAILVLNAWELMLKAKIVLEAGNKIRAIYAMERKDLKDGSKSKKKYIKRNHAGYPQTIGLWKCLRILENKHGIKLDQKVQKNIEAISEIRHNAIHFMNTGPGLAKGILEVGAASVRNFLELARQWFGRNLSDYKLYLMPIGFVRAPGTASGVPVGPDERKLFQYLTNLAHQNSSGSDEFHAALEVNVSLKRVTGTDSTTQVQITRDSTAPAVQLSEEDWLKIWPWDYQKLTKRMGERYIDFKQTNRYHRIRKALLSNKKFCNTRRLDPNNPSSSKKDWYSPNILDEFDKHYTRR